MTDDFAKLLCQWVRDPAIEACDSLSDLDALYPAAKAWKDTSQVKGILVDTAVCVPEAVDETIACLLRAIDEGVLSISFTDSNGNVQTITDKSSDGLVGLFLGADNWRMRFSEQRLFDFNSSIPPLPPTEEFDFSDLDEPSDVSPDDSDKSDN